MQVKILKYDDLGNGLLKINDKVCFVKKALPGEVVNIKIDSSKKNYLKASIINILEESKERILSPCKFYDKCGGCQFLHVKEEEEKRFKKAKCLNFLGRLDNFYETSAFSYRNKVTFHVKDGILGFYEEKSHELVPISFCHLLSPKMNQIIKLFIKKKDSNFQGTLLIRENYQNETMLVIKGEYLYLDYLLQSSLIDNLVYQEKVLKGNDYFFEKIGNYKFKVHYKSFFQVNRIGLLKIYEILKRFLNNKEITNALDLYSGTSVLGIFLSNFSKKVISVEENLFATNDAKFNLQLNRISNLEVINQKVENVISRFKNIDLVIVDPTRNGLDLKTITNILKIKAKYLIYIACGIDALKRDLESLKEVYQVIEIDIVDMFPKTIHMECVGLLCLKDISKTLVK